MSDLELCRVMLPAPMSAVGAVGKVVGAAFPSARAAMRGDHMVIVIDEVAFQAEYDRLSDPDENGDDDWAAYHAERAERAADE